MRNFTTVEVNIDELVKMMVHKCWFCEFEEGQCSSRGGCERGIRKYLATSDEVKLKFPDLSETPCCELCIEKKDN